MPDFDPYHKWLGIRPEERPADHYRLLGITRFEDDADVISDAAEQRMAHVRTYQLGRHMALSQQILNELATARLCLLNPEKKAEYDGQLRATLAAASASAVEPAESSIADLNFAPVLSRMHTRRRSSWLPWVLVGAGGMTTVIFFGLLTMPDEEARIPAATTIPSTLPPKRPAPNGALPRNGDAEPPQKTKSEATAEARSAESAKPSLTLLDDPKPLPAIVPPNADPKVEQAVVQTTSGPVVAAKVRVPVPDPAALEKANKLIEQIYGDQCAAVKANAEKPPSRRITSVVLWNQHNANHNERGTDLCNVALLQGKKELWRSNGLRISWARNKDTFLVVSLPRTGVPADTVRVEVVAWHGNGGGLTEIQAFAGKDNIALGCRATASAKWSNDYPESALTDGILASAQEGKGFWLAPDRTQAWAEVHLRDSEQARHPGSSLAGELFRKAKETQNDDAAHFTLLRLCQEISVLASDYCLAFEAVHEMANKYDVSAVDMEVEVLEKAAKRPRLTPDDKASLAGMALQVLDEAVAEDNYECAGKAEKLAGQLARLSKDKERIQEVAAKAKQVAAATEAYAEIRESVAALAERPDDTEANLAVGKYKCFAKGDWDNGLPMLAKARDGALKELAAKDIAGAASSNEQAGLGDAWWNVSKERAGHWYAMALPGLSGLERDRVAKRAADTEKGRKNDGAAGRKWLVVFRSSEAKLWNTDARRNPDGYAIPLTEVPGDIRYLKLRMSSADYVVVEITKDRLNAAYDGGRFGWNGTNRYQWHAHQLGVYNRQWEERGKGHVGVLTPGGVAFRGWGFGVRTYLDDRQGYAWAGKEIAPTVFELSVTSSPLDAAENRRLLE